MYFTCRKDVSCYYQREDCFRLHLQRGLEQDILLHVFFCKMILWFSKQEEKSNSPYHWIWVALKLCTIEYSRNYVVLLLRLCFYLGLLEYWFGDALSQFRHLMLRNSRQVQIPLAGTSFANLYVEKLKTNWNT